ncbi:MAG: hypothetical protein WDM85_10410 [Caulobacteraceae bacterium]
MRTIWRCQCWATPNRASARAKMSARDLALGAPWRHQAGRLDGVEHRQRLGLGGFQRGAPVDVGHCVFSHR